MFSQYLIGFLRSYALRTGRLRWLYRRYAVHSGFDWGNYVRKWGGLNACGEHVAINLGCNITDPALVRIGNNVTLSDCSIFGHDGSVSVICRAYNMRVDAVGPVEIRDNCFIGHHAIVMPNVTIGPNAIVAAGSVVTKDVLPGTIVAGVPAKVVGSFDEYAKKLQARTDSYPWAHLIVQRGVARDPAFEPTLEKMRVDYFFPVGRAKSAGH